MAGETGGGAREIFEGGKRGMVIKEILPGLWTEYVTPHVCARRMEHIADDWEYCPYCGEPTGLYDGASKTSDVDGKE